MAKRQDKCVDMESLDKGQAAEELMCSICLQFMVKPFRTNCHGEGKHIYGYNCIKQWSSQREKKCPLCRTPFTELSPYLQLHQRIQSAKAICKDCQQLQPVRNMSIHQIQCSKRQERIRSELAEVVKRQKGYLQIQITPHLQKNHRNIFDEHVQDWEWLLHDPRNWKWWWWATMPWWNGQACQICNDLWHKYENDVDREEAQRIVFLGELGIEQQKKEEQQEKVRCQNQ